MLRLSKRVLRLTKRSTDLGIIYTNSSTGTILTDSTHVTVALLNERSLVIKLADIEADQDLQNTHVLGFCETWLSPAPDSSPVIKDNQVVLRCDRATKLMITREELC